MALVWLALAAQPCAAQWLEVSLRVESVFPRMGTSGLETEHRRTNDVRCVFGANTWLIEGEFARNARTIWWCTGTNIIEHELITKEFEDHAEDSLPVGEWRRFFRYPRAGEQHTRLFKRSDRQPLARIEQLTWLAFCSTPFLKSDGRQLTPPIPDNGAGYRGHGETFADKTGGFNDSLGLPERVELFQPKGGAPFCVYNVLQSTNVVGWNVPIQFDFLQYRRAGPGAGRLVLRASGLVTSNSEAKEPVVPPDLVKVALVSNLD